MKNSAVCLALWQHPHCSLVLRADDSRCTFSQCTVVQYSWVINRQALFSTSTSSYREHPWVTFRMEVSAHLYSRRGILWPFSCVSAAGMMGWHVSEAQQQHTHHISGDEADAWHWWGQHLPRQGNVPHWLPQCLALSLQVTTWPKQLWPQSLGVLARPCRAAAFKCNIMTLCLVSSCTTEQLSCSFTCFPTDQTHQTPAKDTVREAAQKILTSSMHIAFGNHGDWNVSNVINQVQRQEGGERSIIDSVT